MIIIDYSCKLKEYALNREPKRFMSIRVTSDRFHENNHKTCSSSFKTSSYPSLRSANSEACEQFNSVLRRISSSTTYMQQSLFMRAITLFIADQNIIANQKTINNNLKCWPSFLLSTLSELWYLRTHLWRYLRVLRFQLTLSQSTAKMCAHASICAWTCENQSKNIYACLDLRKSLHKCLLKKIRLLQFAL